MESICRCLFDEEALKDNRFTVNYRTDTVLTDANANGRLLLSSFSDW